MPGGQGRGPAGDPNLGAGAHRRLESQMEVAPTEEKRKAPEPGPQIHPASEVERKRYIPWKLQMEQPAGWGIWGKAGRYGGQEAKYKSGVRKESVPLPDITTGN